MSWDSYIDNLLAHAPGSVDKACIIGIDGGSPWTSASHANALNLSADEGANIGKVVKSKDLTPFHASGIVVEGVKYQFLRSDENMVFAKKKGHGALTLQSSKTAIVIGHTAEGQQQGEVNKAVAVVAEYLESLGM